MIKYEKQICLQNLKLVAAKEQGSKYMQKIKFAFILE